MPELESITRQYRELRFNSYRLIYRVRPECGTVLILVITHVKRNIQTLLTRGLLP